MVRELKGCDTFVAFPPNTKDCVIFGKNSDRPENEVQEVIFYPSTEHDTEGQLQCTYITIPQVRTTHAIILSRPSWLWGAEMGANEFGVCIGNEAIWTNLTDDDLLKEEKLLGMDLVRLGLERGRTAEMALTAIIELLSAHGQGGLCSEDGMTYHNSFLICDRKEAWVLETAGHLWVAEHITEGTRNISNELTIRATFHKHHEDLYRFVEEKGWWKAGDKFDFAEIFTPGKLCEGKRLREGRRMLNDFSADGDFRVANMMEILRNKNSEICRGNGTTGSQVSLLGSNSSDSAMAACHWFTATPDPSKSLFKPFVFTKDNKIGVQTRSPSFGDDDPRLSIPRFQKVVDRQHPLWRAHAAVKDSAWGPLTGIIREMEANCVSDMEDLIRLWGESEASDSAKPSSMGCTNVKKLAEIFTHLVEMEMNFYKSA